MDIEDELGISFTGSRYVDPEIDFAMRKFALQQSIARCGAVRIELGPQDVVAVAHIFYQFLKGETK